jgi:hypothetical protein
LVVFERKKTRHEEGNSLGAGSKIGQNLAGYVSIQFDNKVLDDEF